MTGVNQMALAGLAMNGRASSLRPFFGFYGGKWRDAVRNYPAPRHTTIVEPFAGSAGYSVRYAHLRVILCDLDPILAGVWRYLVRTSAAEILLLPDLGEGECVDDLPLCQEARWLVGFWLNKGVASPRKRPSAWMRSGVRPGSFWGSRARQTIASQVEEIRHWRVIEGDYRDLRVAGPATWFVDPPYQGAGKHYRCGSDRIDFDVLGAWCHERSGQTIVCENVGATWLPFSPLASVKATRPGQRSSEGIWVQS